MSEGECWEWKSFLSLPAGTTSAYDHADLRLFHHHAWLSSILHRESIFKRQHEGSTTWLWRVRRAGTAMRYLVPAGTWYQCVPEGLCRANKPEGPAQKSCSVKQFSIIAGWFRFYFNGPFTGPSTEFPLLHTSTTTRGNQAKRSAKRPFFHGKR